MNENNSKRAFEDEETSDKSKVIKLDLQRQQTNNTRQSFWSSKHKRYFNVSNVCNEFPNGRWGNSAAPSFGDLNEYHLFRLHNQENKDELLKQWSFQLENEADIWNVFKLFISGEENANNVKIKQLPWCEDGLLQETFVIRDKLSYWNSKGVLTISSQPNVNCARSDDKIFGWGNEKGYVYQKAFLEFFTNKENLEYLKEALKEYPQISYHITNKDNTEDHKNCDATELIVVTWGVFRGKEIIKPTVVDPVSFEMWKDQAFSLWTERWGKLYETNSKSRNLIEYVANNYLFVNLVDNNYPKENCLWSLLTKMLELKEQSNS